MPVSRSHSSRGIYRTRAQTQALREECLCRWAAGDAGASIAADLKISRGYVDSLVTRARNAGDHRAVQRRSESPSDGWKKVVYGPHGDRVWRLSCEGNSPQKIAKITGVSVRSVKRELCRQRSNWIRALDMIDNGTTPQQVSAKLNLPVARVEMMSANRGTDLDPRVRGSASALDGPGYCCPSIGSRHCKIAAKTRH